MPSRFKDLLPLTICWVPCHQHFFDEGQAEGRPVKVIYHSHCDAGAYFSEEDAATFANGGQLMWPCAYIVVSIMDGKVAERRLWVHEPGTNHFKESTLRILDET